MCKSIRLILKTSLMVLAINSVNAGGFDNGDDIVAGFEIVFTFGTGLNGQRVVEKNYNAMLIRKTNGVKDGIAFTISNDNTFGSKFLLPSRNYNLSMLETSKLMLPIMQANPSNDSIADDDFIVGIGLIVAGVAVLAYAKSKLNDIDDAIETE